MDVNAVAFFQSVVKTSPSQAISTVIGSVFVHTSWKKQENGGASLKNDTTVIGLSGSLEDTDKRRRVREQET